MNHRAQDWRCHSDLSRECCHWISIVTLVSPAVADAFPDGAGVSPDEAVASSPDLATGLRHLATGLRRTPSGTNPCLRATFRERVFPRRAECMTRKPPRDEKT